MCLHCWGLALTKGLTLIQSSWSSAQPEGGRTALPKRLEPSLLMRVAIWLQGHCLQMERSRNWSLQVQRLYSWHKCLSSWKQSGPKEAACVLYEQRACCDSVRNSGTQEKALGEYGARDRLVVPSHSVRTRRLVTRRARDFLKRFA